jgi:hypothetical protein
MAMNTLGEETIRRSLFVTDSLDDKPLLEKCAMPLRVIWPKAAYEQALSRVYLPGQYVSRVKRPGERYIFRGILQEDFAFWVLCSIELGQHPVFHILGLGFLLVSFWAIYERGYVDNDFVAAKFEDAPKLSNNFWLTSVATPKLLPWIWAAVTGAAAIWLLRAMQPIQLLDAAKWSAVLIGTYLWFRLYNRYDKMTRTWMFGGLQFLRSAAFLVLVPCELMGVAALGAHVLSRWVPYFLYRFGGNSWPNNITQTIRLMFFLVLALLFMMAVGVSVILNWTTALILSWNLFRARKELPDLLKSAKRIDKNTTK